MECNYPLINLQMALLKVRSDHCRNRPSRRMALELASILSHDHCDPSMLVRAQELVEELDGRLGKVRVP